MASYLGVEVSELRNRARDAITALSDRLDALRSDLDERERAVQAFRSTNRITEGAGTTIIEEQLARLNEELIRAQSSLAMASAISRQRDVSDSALPQVVNSPLIQTLRAQAAEQERLVSELSALYQPSHPKLIQARDALGAIRTTINEETAKIADSLGTSEEVEAERVDALSDEVERLRDQLNQQRAAEIELRRLEREVEASRRVYEAFLNRFNVLPVLTSTAVVSMKPNPSATSPSSPSPSPPLSTSSGWQRGRSQGGTVSAWSGGLVFSQLGVGTCPISSSLATTSFAGNMFRLTVGRLRFMAP